MKYNKITIILSERGENLALLDIVYITYFYKFIISLGIQLWILFKSFYLLDERYPIYLYKIMIISL